MQIKITIPDTKFNELKTGLLKAIAFPEDWKSYTDNQKIKLWLKEIIFNAYKTGKINIAKETTIPDIQLDVITGVD